MPKLLALLSNPDGEEKLRMDREIKEINSRISFKAVHDFQCTQVPAINIDELPGLLIKEAADLIHFSGHGNNSILCFEDKSGRAKLISNDALVGIFKETGKYTSCMIISSCGSSNLAEKISKYIPHVIGFPGEIKGTLSETFSKTFYETLSLGQTFSSSFNLASAAIMTDMEPALLPQLFENKSLENYNKKVFREPFLVANFNTSKRANRPIENEVGYQFNFDVLNIPLNSSYIVYEFIYEDVEDENRFILVEDLKSGSNVPKYELYGNITVRAWLWIGERNYGIGIQASLGECLNNYYGKKIPPNVKTAYDYIVSH